MLLLVAAPVRISAKQVVSLSVTEHLVPSHGTAMTLTWPPCIFPPATIVIQTPFTPSGEKKSLYKNLELTHVNRKVKQLT